MNSTDRLFSLAAAAALLALSPAAAEAATPSAAQALGLTPIQNDVNYDQPDEAEAAKCQIKAEKGDGGSGWVVSNPVGVVLRRFVDTNADNKVDQWCYFKDGIEVYRDVDSDYNGKADQYRWLGTAGIRWGQDRDEDGKIDAWKMISAEEVTAEVVAALRERDAARFTRLLITPAELKSLGLGSEHVAEIEKRLAASAAGFEELSRLQRVVGPQSQWIDFAGQRPGVVAKGTAGSTKDLVVYDNVAAMVEAEGRHAQVPVGTLIQVGDVWRLFDLPAGLIEAQTSAGGFFFNATLVQTTATEAPTVEGGLSEEIQKLIAEYQQVEQQLAAAAPAQKGAIHARRADVMEKLIDAATGDGERANWVRQYADTIGPAAQSGEFNEGPARLAALYRKLSAEPADAELAAYVKYRYMSATYNLQIQDPKADFAKVQEEWVKTLERFVSDHPQSDDAPDAMMQIALAQEFAGKETEARQWYARIAAEHPRSDLSAKARGAVRRLDAVGQPIAFRGGTVDGGAVDLSSYRGKVVLLHYWATWCEPCKQDLTVIRQLQAKYGRAGFEPIGVSLDSDKQTLVSYLQSSRLPWPQVYEEGGLDSRPANELGILSLPTMILIGPDGKVISRNIHSGELEAELQKLLR